MNMTNQPKKSVRFNEKVNLRLYVSPYSIPDVRKRCWYTDEEYEEIRKSIEKQIGMLEDGYKLKDEKYCERGLEKFVGDEFEDRVHYKAMAYRAVLVTQRNQRQKAKDDDGIITTSKVVDDWDNLDDKIANMYRLYTADCQRHAYVVALGDQRAAEKNTFVSPVTKTKRMVVVNSYLRSR